MDGVWAALHNVAKLVSHTLELLAVELADEEGVALHEAQLHHLHITHKQDGGVLAQLLHDTPQGASSAGTGQGANSARGRKEENLHK